ncbi:hypothetical protein LWI29_018388 [Acer saccharum]|uniref:Protein kinase domain-containing protein n=1 Tax=Acer saccharum TaxID=4024 RepID=A0AA39SBC4_ACESA|nr:hypothetical protein LWI29_018388 [Acer saccharum]
MLDSKSNAKLRDFGLAELVDHVNGPQTSTVAGNVGYMAHEYIRIGKASKDSDVYSFEIVVLEIACGRSIKDQKQKNLRILWLTRLGTRTREKDIKKKLRDNFDRNQVETLMTVGFYMAVVDCFQGLICGIVAEDFVKLRTELFEFLRVQRGPHRTSVDDREDSDHRDGDVYPNSDSCTTDKGVEYDSRQGGDGTNHMAMEASISDSVQTAPTQSLPTPPSQLEPHLPMQTDPTPSLHTPPATTQTATAAAAQLQPHPPMQTALIPSLPTPSSTTQTATTEAAQLQPFLRLWNAAGSGDCGIIDVLEANFVKPAAADDANQDEISHDQVSFEYNEPQQDLLPHGRIPKRIRTSLSMIQEQAALIDILVEERKQRDEVEAGLRETRREAYNTISELVEEVKELVEKVKQLEGRGR